MELWARRWALALLAHNQGGVEARTLAMPKADQSGE